MKRTLLTTLIVLLLIAFLGGSFFIMLYTDWLWFESLGFSSIFSTILNTELIMIGLSSLLLFIVIFVNLKIVQRWLAKQGTPNDPEVIQVDFNTGARIPAQRFGRELARHPFLNWIIVIISFFLALANGFSFSGQWLSWRSFLNQVPYGINDPIFGLDVSFYLFSLPVLQGIYDTIFPLLLLLIGVIAFLYLTNHGFDGSFNQRTPYRHLGTLGAIAFLLRGAGFLLDILQLVYSPRGVAFGASYTDIHALMPVYYISIALSILCALMMLTLWGKPRRRMLIIAPLLLIGFSFIGIGAYPNLIQSMQVTPNEIVLEKPYLENNIAFTRIAYDLDTTLEVDFPIGGVADWDELDEYSHSISNIPLLNYRQTQVIFRQLQGIRPYYQFNDIDVDRYRIDGQLTQLMVGPRELTHDALQTGADTWVNRYLKYTHGYGAVATPVKEFTAEGQPILLVQDIPPVNSVSEMQIDQPRIYFGELTSDYAIVDTKSHEFDYPQGSNQNMENDYDGLDGLPMTSLLDKLLFSLRLGTPNPLLTNEVTEGTRILLYRQIMDRAKKIAPFLHFDSDPYLVIDQGRLIWIIDAYTVSSYFPFSQPWSQLGYNYIRNSVKITIDAYDGQPHFYICDERDPLIQTYRSIFPELFQSLEEMPSSLRDHLRYPEDLFRIQANMLLSYHMTDPGVFYNQEDKWAYANQAVSGGVAPAEPYYAIMSFPDFEQEEFMIMLPLTPVNKDNMVAYLAGRCDGDHLGELFIFNFPKDRLVYGPAQIQARINQEAGISQDLALWRQSGAAIEWGHMITVPLKDSLLYVMPLYITSASSPFPELKRIVVAYGNALVMEETLEAGLRRIFGTPGSAISPEISGDPTGDSTGTPPSDDSGVTTTPLQQQLIDNLVRQYDRVQDAFTRGDWAAYGREMSELESLIRQLEQQNSAGPSVGESSYGGDVLPPTSSSQSYGDGDDDLPNFSPLTSGLLGTS